MFKRLTDRLSIAVTGVDPNVRTLTAMGFAPEDARQALNATRGNVDQATELLLVAAGGGEATTTTTTTTSAPSRAINPNHARATQQQQQPYPSHAVQQQENHSPDDDVMLHRVMQESLQMEEERQFQSVVAESSQGHYRDARLPQTAVMQHVSATATTTERRAASVAATTLRPTRTAAMNKAAQAATERGRAATTPTVATTATNLGGLSMHHPDVKVIPKLQDKSKEEQILRCADRLKASPQAVDTLYKALTAVQKDPDNSKFRKIDKSTAGYQRSVAPAAGAEDFLRAMSFRSSPGTPQMLMLDRSMVDPALLYLGISALEQTRLSPEYREAKQKLHFAKTVADLLGPTNKPPDADEMAKRVEHEAKCPTERSEGGGALVQVILAETTLRRRFDGDDTLLDVLHWLGSQSSIIYDHLMNSREWCIADRNRYPIVPIDCHTHQSHTLQYLGCWPSGKFEILPSTDAWKHGLHGTLIKPGSSRGLASAPSEVL